MTIFPSRVGRIVPDEMPTPEGKSVRTLMWEAKAAPGRDGELLAWALEHADPAADVYLGGDGRVVVIDGTGRGLPDAPDELLARPAHVWPFERVPR